MDFEQLCTYQISPIFNRFIRKFYFVPPVRILLLKNIPYSRFFFRSRKMGQNLRKMRLTQNQFPHFNSQLFYFPYPRSFTGGGARPHTPSSLRSNKSGRNVDADKLPRPPWPPRSHYNQLPPEVRVGLGWPEQLVSVSTPPTLVGTDPGWGMRSGSAVGK